MLILLANSSHPYCSTRELSIISNLIPCNGLFGCSINFNSYIILLKSDYTRKKRKIQKKANRGSHLFPNINIPKYKKSRLKKKLSSRGTLEEFK